MIIDSFVLICDISFEGGENKSVVLASTAIQLLDDRKSPIVAGTCFHISKQYDYIIIYCFLNVFVFLAKMQMTYTEHF